MEELAIQQSDQYQLWYRDVALDKVPKHDNKIRKQGFGDK